MFDLEHSKCPNDGHELQVQQMTPMPSLRLTEDEARDIASYLMTRKRSTTRRYAERRLPGRSQPEEPGPRAGSQSTAAPDATRSPGLEEEQRIGTELTKEGSKPIERLDFALLGHKAEAEGWYTHKGFFEHKLENPAVYDQGKEKAKQDRLKMPNFNLSKPEIDAVTTFLEGSVDASVPRAVLLHADRSAAGHHRRLVGGPQVQLHGLPPGPRGADHHVRHADAVSGSGLEGPEAAHADRRRRARPARLADALPEQSGAERDGHESRRRAAVSKGANAHVQLLRWRDPEAGALLRGAVVAGAAVHRGAVGSADATRSAAWRAALFSSEGAPCLKCHMTGDAEARRQSDGAELHGRQGAAEAGLDQAVDAGSGDDESGDGDAVGPVHAARTERWVFAGPTPASFNGYPKDHADLLVRYMFQFTPEELGRLRSSAGAGISTVEA